MFPTSSPCFEMTDNDVFIQESKAEAPIKPAKDEKQVSVCKHGIWDLMANDNDKYFADNQLLGGLKCCSETYYSIGPDEDKDKLKCSIDHTVCMKISGCKLKKNDPNYFVPGNKTPAFICHNHLTNGCTHIICNECHRKILLATEDKTSNARSTRSSKGRKL